MVNKLVITFGMFLRPTRPQWAGLAKVNNGAESE
jgi:hypothetical protein